MNPKALASNLRRRREPIDQADVDAFAAVLDDPTAPVPDHLASQVAAARAIAPRYYPTEQYQRSLLERLRAEWSHRLGDDPEAPAASAAEPPHVARVEDPQGTVVIADIEPIDEASAAEVARAARELLAQRIR